MNEAAHSTPLWRIALKFGIAMGLLLGISEVAWAYHLNIIFADKHHYLPVDSFWPFTLVALAIDTSAVVLGALGVGLGVALLRAIVPFSKNSRIWGVVCRWGILAGPSVVIFSYWYVSYIMLGPHPHWLEIRLAGQVAILVVTFLISWGLERLAHSRGEFAETAVFGVVFLILLGFSWRGFEINRAANPPPAAAQVEPAQGDNVVLFTLDTLRADYLPIYGHPIIETPNLEALAADGFVFETAIAQAGTTTPSHSSILTSLYPAEHGAMNGVAIRPGISTFTNILSQGGYHTVAFLAATPLRSNDSGLHQGFDRYLDSVVPFSTIFGKDQFQQLALFQTMDLFFGASIAGRYVTQRVQSWLDERPDQAFFAWIHYFDPHIQYSKYLVEDYPNPYEGLFDQNLKRPKRHETYGGRIKYTDAQVGIVLDELKERGLYDDTLIIVTSDHGESLDEFHDGRTDKDHGNALYDPTQRVPLIIKPARSRLRGGRVTHQVRSIDIAPTVLESLGFEIPTDYSGSSLVGVMHGDESAAPPQRALMQVVRYRVSGESPDAVRKKNLLGLRTPDTKYLCNIDGEDEQLYDLQADPLETVNIIELHRDEAARLKEEIFAVLEPTETSGEGTEMDPRVLKRLQALGYMLDDE